MNQNNSLDNRVGLMKSVAKEAGEKIVDTHLLEIKKSKAGNQDILTLGDLESERIIIDRIKNNFPDDKILSEEDSPEEQVDGYGGYLWVIDPIDGTINYARNRKSSVISVGLVYKSAPVAGAIYNPYSQELFWALENKGAYLNSESISVSNVKNFKKALCLTDNGDKPEVIRKNLTLLMHIPEFERLAVTGSAVMHFAEIASGRSDFYLHTFLKPWDNAAGFILVKEAGGVIKTLGNRDATFLSSETVTGNKKIVEEYFRTRKS